MPKGKSKNLIKKGDSERYRWWSVVAYPESLHPDWLDVLDSYHIPFGVSPLHDKDVNPTGEVKKPHYHIVLYFEGKKSYQQIVDIFNEVGGCAPPKCCHSPKGAVRYFAHLDNPEKYQYNFADSQFFGGMDPTEILELTLGQKQQYAREMTQFIIDNKITSFSSFAIYCVQFNYDWFYVLTNCNTYYFANLLKSQYFDNGSTKYLDVKTKTTLIPIDK